MGLKNWLMKRALKRVNKQKAVKVDDLDALILEEIKEAKKANTMREKLLKLKLAQQVKNDQLEEMRRDIEGDDDAPQETGGFEEQIGQMILGKLLGGGIGQQPNPEQLGDLGSLEEKAKGFGITDEQIEQFKKEFPLK